MELLSSSSVFELRLILLLTLFGLASVYDYKTRKIPDLLWVVFAGTRGFLYVFGYQDTTVYHVMSFFTSSFFGFMLYRFRFVGMADMFAVISISVILPVHYKFVMVPIAVTVLALILVVISVTIYNVVLNMIDLMSKRRSLYENFPKEPFYRKAFAFFCIHRKRRYERFVISSEKYYPAMPENRSFELISRGKNISKIIEGDDGFVQNFHHLFCS